MPRDEFGHLEHADLLLATKDHLQRVIGVDQSPLLLVLELVLLDVVPQLFWSTHREAEALILRSGQVRRLAEPVSSGQRLACGQLSFRVWS
jgi:hypothetical protein